MGNKLYVIFAWIIVFFVFLLSIYVQSQLFLQPDTSWLLDATQRLLQGGTYYNNFFEPGAPMVLYLYIPAVLFAKYTGINLIIGFRVYIYFIAIILLFFYTYLTKKMISRNDRFTEGLLLVALSVVLFILPINEFGSRENLVILLIIPYLFTCILRIQNKPIHGLVLFAAGVLGGIGFMINIYFISIFLLVELYLILKKRLFFYWIRTEFLLILFLALSYLVSIFIFTPTYLSKVLPFVMHLYVNHGLSTWGDLLVTPLVASWLFILLLIIVLRNTLRNPNMTYILLLASTGFLITYLVDARADFQHLIPMLSILTLLAFLLLTDAFLYLLAHSKMPKFKNICYCAYLTLLFGTIIYIIPAITQYHVLKFMQEKRSARSLPNELIKFIDLGNYRGPVYFFSTSTSPGSIVVSYSMRKSASRFPYFWLLPGVLNQNKPQQVVKTAKIFLVNAVIKDFQKYKPNLVFVNIAKRKKLLVNIKFDYIRYFSQDKRFKKIWKHYIYKETIQNYAVYIKRHKAIR